MNHRWQRRRLFVVSIGIVAVAFAQRILIADGYLGKNTPLGVFSLSLFVLVHAMRTWGTWVKVKDIQQEYPQKGMVSACMAALPVGMLLGIGLVWCFLQAFAQEGPIFPISSWVDPFFSVLLGYPIVVWISVWLSSRSHHILTFLTLACLGLGLSISLLGHVDAPFYGLSILVLAISFFFYKRTMPLLGEKSNLDKILRNGLGSG